MKRPLDTHERLLPPLDAEPGPMPQLSAAEADAIARGIVSRWAARPPGLEPADDDVGPSQPLTRQAAERLARSALRVHTRKQFLSASTLRAAVAALCLSGAMGIAFAAYRLWPALPSASMGNVSARQLQAAEPTDTAARAAEAQQQQRSSTAPATLPTPTEVRPAAGEPKLAQQADPARETAAVEHAPTTLEDPEALLARANALRAKRRWAAAESTYRQVESAEASEQQRYVALVAAASIALQHLDKPGRALSLYQSALSLLPHGNLDEQALYGVAECYRALKNPAAELKTLQRLSTEHPAGLLVDSAKRRVATLTEDAAKQP